MPTFRNLAFFAASGLGLGVTGAMTHEDVFTWTGVAIAAGSAVVSSAIASYHSFRKAVRDEATKDRMQEIKDVHKLTEAHVDLENRIRKSEFDIVEIASRVEKVRCAFPNPDGTARCRGLTEPIPPQS